MEANEIAAYQRGWNAAQDWQHPQINPYVARTPEWTAWNLGAEEGGVNSMAVCMMLREQAH